MRAITSGHLPDPSDTVTPDTPTADRFSFKEIEGWATPSEGSDSPKDSPRIVRLGDEWDRAGGGGPWDDDDSDDISLSTFHKLLHNRAMLQDKQSPALIEKLWRIACPVLPRPEDYATHGLGPNDFRQFLRSWAAHVAAACPPEDPPVSAPAPPAEVARYRHVCAEKERAMIIFVENRTKETLQLLQGRSFCSEGEFSDSNVWQQGTCLVLQPSGGPADPARARMRRRAVAIHSAWTRSAAGTAYNAGVRSRGKRRQERRGRNDRVPRSLVT